MILKIKEVFSLVKEVFFLLATKIFLLKRSEKFNLGKRFSNQMVYASKRCPCWYFQSYCWYSYCSFNKNCLKMLRKCGFPKWIKRSRSYFNAQAKWWFWTRELESSVLGNILLKFLKVKIIVKLKNLLKMND